MVVIYVSFIKAKVIVDSDHIQDHHYSERGHKVGMPGVFQIEMYECLIEFFSAGVEHCPSDRLAPRLLSLGYAVFILFTIACYAGNLTAILTTSQFEPKGYTSFQDCIDKKCSICVESSLYDSMKRVYGSAGADIRVASSSSGGYFNIINALQSGECDVGLMDDTTYKINMMNAMDICDFRYVGPELLWIPVAQPVRYDLATSMNYWYREIVAGGEVDEIFHEYVPEYSTICDPFLIAFGDDCVSSSESLTYKSLIGPALLCVVFALIALLFDLRENGWSNFKNICTMQFGLTGAYQQAFDIAQAEPVEDDDVIDIPKHIFEFHARYKKGHADIMKRLDILSGIAADDTDSRLLCDE